MYPRQKYGIGMAAKHGTLTDYPKAHAMKNPRSTETPAQTIKRLQKELATKNAIMKSMMDVFDKQYGAGLRKKVFTQIVLEKATNRQISLL